MTNASSDRLDRIENDLETVKDILLTVARRAESTDERLERYAEAFDRRMSATQNQIHQTTANVDTLSATVNELTTNAEADRVVMYEVIDQLVSLREDNQRILEYLFGQQRGNGHGDPPE